MSDTTEIKIHCHCRAVDSSIHLKTADLPIGYILCECDSCRHVSGMLATSCIPYPHELDMKQFSSLQAYKFSENMSMYFCKTCGAHVFFYWPKTGRLEIMHGLLDRLDGIVKLRGGMFIGDTLDGGISNFLATKDGSELERLETHRGKQLSLGWISDSIEHIQPQQTDKLHAKCHCGGVQLYITRPGSDSDLWYLGEDKTKWPAQLCVCDSCRKTIGFDVASFSFVAPNHIFAPDGSQPDLAAPEVKLGTCKTYHSSKGVHREFCGTCGANVFYRCDDRKEMIDVCVGLYDSKYGARQEPFLFWSGRVSYKEDIVNRELLECIEAGLPPKTEGTHI